MSAEDAEYRLADVFTGVGVRLHTRRCIVHVYGCLHKCEYVLQGADADSVCVHSCSPGALVKNGEKCYKADFFRIVT